MFPVPHLISAVEVQFRSTQFHNFGHFIFLLLSRLSKQFPTFSCSLWHIHWREQRIACSFGLQDIFCFGDLRLHKKIMGISKLNFNNNGINAYRRCSSFAFSDSATNVQLFHSRRALYFLLCDVGRGGFLFLFLLIEGLGW